MNKEDVQYGDWFRYKYTEGGEEDGEIDYFYHDFRVNQIYFGMGIDDVSGEEGDIYSVEDIEPVPLTDEILIANGFESNPYSPGNGFHLLSLEVEVNIGNDNRWKPTAHNMKFRADVDKHDWLKTKSHQSRTSYCYQYIGPPIQGFDNLILPIDKIRRIRGLEGQLSLF